MNKIVLSGLVSMLAAIVFSSAAEACTSMIISSRVTADGRPLMLKHRDSSAKDVFVSRFHGSRYDFIGVADAGAEPGQVWTGTNSAGFSIMNTASYNFKDDDVPSSMMDLEGFVMFMALGKCRTASDFENMLDTLPRPLGVEANFGVIDADGSACYYEVNNDSWFKFDVNDEAVSPSGYRIVTNFCTLGRRDDDMGVERYMTASDIMSGVLKAGKKISLSPQDIFTMLSRSYRNSFTGLDYVADYRKLVSRKTGTAVDQDFIPRYSTSCSVVFHGVRPGDNPSRTVMWTVLGYPACSAAMPLLVGNSDILPYFVKPSDDGRSAFCNAVLSLKRDFVFRWNVSNGRHYLDMENLVRGRAGRKPLLECASSADMEIAGCFNNLYSGWSEGKIDDGMFYNSYTGLSSTFLHLYLDNFKDYSVKMTKLAE